MTKLDDAMARGYSNGYGKRENMYRINKRVYDCEKNICCFLVPFLGCLWVSYYLIFRI